MVKRSFQVLDSDLASNQHPLESTAPWTHSLYHTEAVQTQSTWQTTDLFTLAVSHSLRLLYNALLVCFLYCPLLVICVVHM